MKIRICLTQKPRWILISLVMVPPPTEILDSLLTTATSLIACFGSRSWVVPRIPGPKLKAVRASPTGLAIARGEEKISRRNLVNLLLPSSFFFSNWKTICLGSHIVTGALISLRLGFLGFSFGLFVASVFEFDVILGVLLFCKLMYFFHPFPVTISDIVACAEEQILNDEQPDMDGCPGGENLDDEGEAMVEEALSGNTKATYFC